MNRAATEDVRSLVWPVVSQVLRRRPRAERDSTPQALDVLDDWVQRGRAAPRRRPRRQERRRRRADHGRGVAADRRGGDAPGVRRPARRPRRRPQPRRARGRVATSTRTCARCSNTAASTVPFNLRYCGNGSLDACRASLWAAFDAGARRARRGAGPGSGDVARPRVAHRASCPGSSPTRSAPRTARPSSRCSSSRIGAEAGRGAAAQSPAQVDGLGSSA